ncbi:hypothetical protein JOF56_003002 [Kibdelosporangium banguiense]|uniref:SH3 domain-containing protein n=1 Tax=Kibdelosporangium banguiense TaxID=1365924 RepID=A0ABS4TDX0_9PSEU|nr:hypothetical protein [Kibdelosporangium banguiense]MBP2322617.1 hypothetical protein [Kibdelosporangium banguiense]
MLKNLRDEAFDSDGRAAEDVNEVRDVSTDEAVETQGADRHHEFTTLGTRSVNSRLFGRGRGRWVLAAAVGIAVATILIVQPWSSSSSSSDCDRYEVTVRGNIVNDAGKDIGEVFPKDVFIVDRSPGYPPLRYRYYGTVENRGVSGYVLQNKLDPLGSCT